MEQLQTLPQTADYSEANLSGKGVLITGGTTGIGRATALLLASKGADVIIFGRHKQELNDTINDFQKAGLEDRVNGMVADVAVKEDIQKVFKKTDQLLKNLDILVNNAAVSYKSILEGNFDDWQYVVNTNLLGYMACAHEAAERMKTRAEGHIINIGSMSADAREKNSSVYVATKAAVHGFSESLRKEVNPMGIKVSLIEPGAVGTDMQPQSPDEQLKKQDALQMLKAEDIAACVLYVLSQPKRCDVVSVQIRPHLQSI